MIRTEELPDVFGSVVFCDDIRAEITGKLIYIGVYPGPILVHSTFPARLPRLAVAISLSQKASLFNPDMNVRIFLPEDTDEKSSIEARISENDEGAAHRQAEAASEIMGVPLEQRKFVHFFTTWSIENIEIKQAGTIRVYVEVGERRYRLGAIQVSSAGRLSDNQNLSGGH